MKKDLNNEYKYKYSLNGVTYFICLTYEEKILFENKYGIYLELWD